MRVEALVVAVCAAGPAAGGLLYVRRDSYFGEDFFRMWSFFDDEDPTHGPVEFVNKTTAVSEGLVKVTSHQVYIGADMETVVADNGGRRSVRIQSNKMYNSGLFIATLDHVPTGCGTWPALWMFGADAHHIWPAWGEFTIIEGAHHATRAMSTLHTTAGCDQSSVVAGRDFLTEWNNGSNGKPATSCDVNAPGQWDNQGCSQAGPRNSMGAAFNAFNGGTFAAEWDPAGGHIRTWFWPVGTEPIDVDMKAPNPSNWGTPYSYFRLNPETCPTTHFRNMRLVIDLTFCGDYGKPSFATACPEFMAANLTCEQFVRKHPEKMKEAYWSISRLDAYQAVGMQMASANVIDVQRRFQSGALGIMFKAPISSWAIGALIGCASLVAVVFAFQKVFRRRITTHLGGDSQALKFYSHLQPEASYVP